MSVSFEWNASRGGHLVWGAGIRLADECQQVKGAVRAATEHPYTKLAQRRNWSAYGTITEGLIDNAASKRMRELCFQPGHSR